MFRFKTMAVVLLASMLPPPTAVGAEETPFGRVILRDTSSRYETRIPEPWLIPLSLLEKRRDQWSAQEQAAVPEELYGKFLDVVERTRDKGLSGNCNPADAFSSSAPSMVTPPEARYSISQITGAEKTAVIGEVVGTEAAWNFLSTQVATLVHVKVTRVVRAVDKVAVGDLLTIRRPWGKASVRGVTLCSTSRFEPPLPGPEAQQEPERQRQGLLLIGHRTAGNPFYFNTGGFGEFRIVDGLVHYPPGYSFYRDQNPEELEEVVQNILRGAKP